MIKKSTQQQDLKILGLLEAGLSPKEIAQDMSISTWQVYDAHWRFRYVYSRGDFPKFSQHTEFSTLL